MSPNPIPLILTIAIVFFYVQPSVLSQQTNDYQTCTPSFRCGTISGIGYPFWDSSRPSYCGHPDFRLTCTNHNATISISGSSYNVLKINTSSRVLTLARPDYLSNVCPQYLHNNSIAPGIFRYADDTLNVTVYYKCSSAVPSNYDVSSRVNCTTNGTRSSSYYVVGDLSYLNAVPRDSVYSALANCSERVVVPANHSVVSDSLSSFYAPDEDRLVGVLGQGFGLVWDATDGACSACKASDGICGYEADSFYCYHGKPPQPGSGTTKMIIAGTTAAGVILVGLVIGTWFLATRKRRKEHSEQSRKRNEAIKAYITNYQTQMPQRYSYSDIKKMTKKFAHKLGQGGFGRVYKGELPDGRLVAVKVLHASDNEAEEFLNEVASIGRTSHVNIVGLLGFCYDKKKALVYQYMPKGSLDKYTYKQGSQAMECTLEWNVLYDIAVGTARGLEYLHRGCNTRIVHLDIKPHNILLDEDFCPKIADFGLAKLYKGKESKVSMMGARGTPGYIAPEVFSRNFGVVSDKSDVYSYGMLVLEMVGARKNFDTGSSEASTKYFPDWIYEKLEQDEILVLQREINETEQEIARKMILVGLWCIQTKPVDRPNMTRVIEMLEDNSRTLPIAPKPNLNLPARSPQYSSSRTSLAPYTSSGVNEDVESPWSLPNSENSATAAPCSSAGISRKSKTFCGAHAGVATPTTWISSQPAAAVVRAYPCQGKHTDPC